MVPAHKKSPSLVCENTEVIRNISEAKAELSALIEQVIKGQEVIITKAGKPVAKLVPIQKTAQPRLPGSLAGKIWMAPDFDQLPDDIAEAFGPPVATP